MSALYTKQPVWPSSDRIARQYTFFNNEGWQLRGGNAYSGLEANTSYTTIAEPNRLTEFVTDPDGIRPTGTINNNSTSITVIERLITWAGFTDDDGVEIPPNYTRSRGAGGFINFDVVFMTDVNFLDGISGIQFDLILDPSAGANTNDDVVETLTQVDISQPVPNVIRARIPFNATGNDGIAENGNWQATPGTASGGALVNSSIIMPSPTRISTVVQTGHTAVVIVPTLSASATVNLPSGSIAGSQILTVIS